MKSGVSARTASGKCAKDVVIKVGDQLLPCAGIQQNAGHIPCVVRIHVLHIGIYLIEARKPDGFAVVMLQHEIFIQPLYLIVRELPHAMLLLLSGLEHAVQHEVTDVREYPVGLAAAVITNAFRICQ